MLADLLAALLASALVPAMSAAQLAAAGPSTEDRITQAAALLQAGEAAKARDLYTSVLASEPGNVQAQAGEVDASERLALQARARGDKDGALRTLLAAQPLAPASPKLLYDLAVLEDSMKLYWDADQVVTKLEAEPGGANPKVLYLAARVKLDLGQLAIAEQKMRGYLAANPGDATAHYGLGRILQLSDQLDAARAEYQRSLELQPHQTESQFQLGEIALAQGHYDEAIADYAKALAGNPAHGGALAGTGIALFRLKQYDQAADALRKAVAAAPDYQPAHYYLGLTLLRLGRKTESDRELARAAEMAVAVNQEDAERLRIQPSSPPPR